MELIQASDLTVNFGGVTALDRFSFHVNRGEIMSLIGPNGAGKTTTFNVLSGFCRPSSGKVLFKGEDLVGLKPSVIAERGLVRTFQKTNIFPGVSVLQSVMIACHKRRYEKWWSILTSGASFVRAERETVRRALEIIEFAGLAERRNDEGRSLSYGEQRLLEIAIALAAEPELLLLDEPAAGMNPAEVDRVLQLIHRIGKGGTTVLLVEHRMKIVMSISDRVVVLHNGRKLYEGLPRDVAEHPDVIQVYLGGGVTRDVGGK